MTKTIYVNFCSHFLRMLKMKFLALIGKAVSEKNMFEYYNDIHAFSPRAGADNPLGPGTQFFS